MKVAVTSSGKTLDSSVDPRFGRAPYFVVVDVESGAFGVHDNARNLNAAQGAGVQSAATVSDLGVDAVITGHCGPNAFRALKAAGIAVVVGAQGSVKDAVEQFKKGKLKPADSADVQGHWA
jgi:predicted Fe-Mo cluster-binding NifX family protein